MKKSTFFTLAAALLAGTSAAQAGNPAAPLVVVPLSTFTFDVSGFNSAGTTGYLLTPDETTTFGTTQTYTAAGINGQNITITSSETVGVSTTTDTFTVSTPTSFLTTSKVNNTTIAEIQFDIGDANAGGGTVNFAAPVPAGYTDSAYLLYEGTTTFSYTPATSVNVFTNNNESLAVGEGVNFGSAISAYSPNTLSYSLTYATVPLAAPEPSTYVTAALGALALGTVLLRRNRRSTGL